MASSYTDLLDKIINPNPDNADEILAELGLSGIQSPEEVHREIEQNLLLPPTKFPDHWLPHYQKYWDQELSIPSLLTLEPSPPPTSLAFVRTGLNGRVTGYTEVSNPRASTGLTSTSLDRAPAPSSNFVRGKSGYVPFWPGGLDEAAKDALILTDLDESSKGLKSIPPGFTRGLRLPGDPDEAEEELLNDIHTEQKLLEEDDVNPTDAADALIREQIGSSEIDDLLPASRSNLNSGTTEKRGRRNIPTQKRDWAHVVDVNKPMSNFGELVPDMAHKYPFELDTFQKEAVYHLEMGDSVFVAAHTSAGKTVVAEYAIALAAKHMTRAIYTSPIKALSNQKYRDFKQTFSASSVGILTGDVQINPEANCLIMTTEILRSMLYKGADLIRDVEFVIFDEVHYVNDAERGVVWEEVIIMLPEHVNIILLSATVPNTKEFADWVGRTKKKDIYVISTAKRPVPLEHFLYAGRALHKIVDAGRNFISAGYKEAGEALRRKQDKEREANGLPPVQRLGARAAAPQRGGRGGPPARGGHRGGAPAASRGGSSRTFHQPDKNLYVHLVGNLRKKDLLPVVVFTFSKKRCEENAGTLTNADLCTASEKSEIHVVIEKALSRLKDVDRKLPQIRRMKDLLSRGIGVHHGGLLPIVKEVVELLFGRGLVKVLFATETFAMGVNMPTRCVVFSHIRKHDGHSFREILPGEYTQMAGRAGRRGLDATGTVIIVTSDELPEEGALRNMITGLPTKLQSQFRLTYNMILNLLRVEALRVEEMIKRSFSENASQRLLPDQQEKVVKTEKALSSLKKLECDVCLPTIERYYDDVADIVDQNMRLLSLVNHHRGKGHKQLLQGGRVVVLRDGYFKGNIGIILKDAPALTSASRVQDKQSAYLVLGVIDTDTKSNKKSNDSDFDPDTLIPTWPIKPQSLTADNPTYILKPVRLHSIAMVTDCILKIDIDKIIATRITAMTNTVDALLGILREWETGGEIPEVDWSGRIRSIDFQETLRARDETVTRLPSYECHECPEFENHYTLLHSEKVLRTEIAKLTVAISEQNLELIPDYEQRVDVLRDLRFIDANSTVLLKGRVACEINSANELVLTELILENTLAAYDPEEVVALLSCFIFQEKTDVEPEIPPKLAEGRDAIVAIAERVERIQEAHKLPTQQFRALKFGLMEVVYEWAKGMPFEQITDLTDVPEGTIVRCITRLDETCREVRDAARVIGDAELFKKMEEAQMKIKRDIVFAASLYF
ncbi:antiviral helicase [Trametopsis cervina]|nr:antiviral helicase [Trametopsis cervina]